jgi:tRNA G18 (ribose-2'-O)-methylase SpoU
MREAHVSSLDDPRIAAYRQVANPAAIERAGLFVAEGRFVVARLLALNRFPIHSLLLTPTAFRALAATTDSIAAPAFVVDQQLMNAVAGFNIHRGCLALAARPPVRAIGEWPMADVARALVLEGVNNPDNVGGLFRSAAAFGVDAVVLGPACGDPLYRKSIRTSMAATLQVPFVSPESLPTAIEALRRHGVRVLALTTANDARPLDTLPRDGRRVALLVGNEGAGLSTAALTLSDECVRIAVTAAVDSLNVTVAASIAMHHFLPRDSDLSA